MTSGTTGAKPARIRVFTVDDHPALREGLASMIHADDRLELFGEAGDGAEAVRLYGAVKPDVTLMDLRMPVMNGVEAIRSIRATFPQARIIVLTTFEGDVEAANALKAGAAGYLLKSSVRSDLLEAITAAHAGARYVHPEVANEIALHVGHEALRDRELRTLELVARGKANKQIAAEMHVSEETVKAYLRSVFAKLGVRDRTQAVMVAVKRGFIGM